MEYATIFIYFSAAPCNPLLTINFASGWISYICWGVTSLLTVTCLNRSEPGKAVGVKLTKPGHLGVWVVRRNARPHKTVWRWQAVEDVHTRTFAIPLQQLYADRQVSS